MFFIFAVCAPGILTFLCRDEVTVLDCHLFRDGYNDCGDGSDEGMYIDGYNDCGDGYDEVCILMDTMIVVMVMMKVCILMMILNHFYHE